MEHERTDNLVVRRSRDRGEEISACVQVCALTTSLVVCCVRLWRLEYQ